MNAQIDGEFHHSHMRIFAPRPSSVESFVALATTDFGNTCSVTVESNLPQFVPLWLASSLHFAPCMTVVLHVLLL